MTRHKFFKTVLRDLDLNDEPIDPSRVFKTLVSSLQDADYAQTISQFQTLQTSLQATLQTQARLLHLSLLDFIG